MATQRFTVELQRVGKTGTNVEIPLDMPAVFGRARPPVKVTVNKAVAMLREGKAHR